MSNPVEGFDGIMFNDTVLILENQLRDNLPSGDAEEFFISVIPNSMARIRDIYVPDDMLNEDGEEIDEDGNVIPFLDSNGDEAIRVDNPDTKDVDESKPILSKYLDEDNNIKIPDVEVGIVEGDGYNYLYLLYKDQPLPKTFRMGRLGLPSTFPEFVPTAASVVAEVIKDNFIYQDIVSEIDRLLAKIYGGDRTGATYNELLHNVKRAIYLAVEAGINYGFTGDRVEVAEAVILSLKTGKFGCKLQFNEIKTSFEFRVPKVGGSVLIQFYLDEPFMTKIWLDSLRRGF